MTKGEYGFENFSVRIDYDSSGNIEISHVNEILTHLHLFLGNYLPPLEVVNTKPSHSGSENSKDFLYLKQNLDDRDFTRTAKTLDSLSSEEFSEDLMWQILDLQNRIETFLQVYSADLNALEGFLQKSLLDPKRFKTNLLYSPTLKKLRLVNFALDYNQLSHVLKNSIPHKPSILTKIGLAGVMEKLRFIIDKSAVREWVTGSGVYWSLDRKKLEQQDKQKAMALTFDDGPNKETEKLLDILKEEGVRATFFLVGSLIAESEENQNIVKRIVAEGHSIGVHEWGQVGESFSNIDRKSILLELKRRLIGPREDLGDVQKTTDLIERVTNIRPKLGRVAGVHGTIDSLREFQLNGLKIIHALPWDIVFLAPSVKLQAKDLLQRALFFNKHGSIRLFHIGKMEDGGHALKSSDIRKEKGEVYPPEETLKMIRAYIQTTKKQGFEFVLVGEYV